MLMQKKSSIMRILLGNETGNAKEALLSEETAGAAHGPDEDRQRCEGSGDISVAQAAQIGNNVAGAECGTEQFISLHFIYCDCERCLTQRVFENAQKNNARI